MKPNSIDVVKEFLKLNQQPGKDISIGGLSIASQLSQRGFLDEYHFVVQPFVTGKGSRLFEAINLKEKLQMELVGSKTFRSGVVALHDKKRSS